VVDRFHPAYSAPHDFSTTPLGVFQIFWGNFSIFFGKAGCFYHYLGFFHGYFLFFTVLFG
jgi:hypothetical protein